MLSQNNVDIRKIIPDLEAWNGFRFPVTIKVEDAAGAVYLEEASWATLKFKGNNSQVDYDTDITYHHKRNKSVILSFKVYKDGELFSVHPCPIRLVKGNTLRFFGTDSPREVTNA